MNGQTRAALYARVSTEEQTEGYSIDAQRRAFQTLCEGRGWTIHHEYVEAGKSAHTENINKRPLFKEMIADALAGGFDILVVHKLDRFSRSLLITVEYFNKLLRAGVTFFSISEQMDFTSPSGRVHLALLGAFAQYYSDNLSQETKKGWSERKAQGLYCGLLPFGAMKGENGVPVPHPDTFPGLLMAFELATEGKSNREIAMALNARGFRTAGNQGNRPFSKDTVVGMLQNRFYLGELPDGNGGSVEAKHEPFVRLELFQAVQDVRARRGRVRQTINVGSRVYSLSALMRSKKCGSKMRIQRSPRGEPRIYCAGRAQGLGCGCKGTFLEVYETQIRWYLDSFTIPEDYQVRMLEAHRKLMSAYDDVGKRKAMLEARHKKLTELYEWGHKSREEYLADYEEVQRELRQLAPVEDKSHQLERLAQFLSNVAAAWDEANQEQRNKLAKTLFDEIVVEDDKVVAAKPQPELEPFFKVDFECRSRDIAGDPDGIRGGRFKLLVPLVKRYLEERFQLLPRPDGYHSVILQPYFVEELSA